MSYWRNCIITYILPRWRLFYPLLLILSLSLPLAGQFQRLTLKDGLSQSQVFCIHQDRQGFLWFGTLDGLNKYDGVGFQIFSREINSQHTLSDNNILALCEDDAGILWIGTEGGGLNWLDPITGQFSSMIHDPDSEESLSNNFVNTILKDGRGKLWIGTNGGGLNLLDPLQYTCKRFFFSTNSRFPGRDRIYAVVEVAEGRLWVGTAEGLIDFKPQSGTATCYTVNNRQFPLLSHNQANA